MASASTKLFSTKSQSSSMSVSSAHTTVTKRKLAVTAAAAAAAVVADGKVRSVTQLPFPTGEQEGGTGWRQRMDSGKDSKVGVAHAQGRQ